MAKTRERSMNHMEWRIWGKKKLMKDVGRKSKCGNRGEEEQ